MPPINRCIVITSIYAPGEAVRCFAALPDWPLVVVADRKTPRDWQLAGARLGFTGPTVRQERNGHDCMDDFRSELPLFLEAENMMAVIGAAVRAGASFGDNLHRVYTRLVGKGFVGAEEMTLVDAWLEDVTALS